MLKDMRQQRLDLLRLVNACLRQRRVRNGKVVFNVLLEDDFVSFSVLNVGEGGTACDMESLT